MGRLRRGPRQGIAALAVCALALTGVLAVPAAAQEYPPTPIIDVDDPIVPEGNIVTITGSGFLPNSVVCLCILGGPEGFAQAAGLASVGAAALTQEEQAIATCLALGGIVIGTTISDANGDWSFAWDTSEFPPGDYAIAATDGTNTLAVDVRVTPPVGPTPTSTVPSPVVPVGPSLPQTGGIAQGTLRAGAVLLAAGGLLLLAVRTRRPTAHAARS